MVRRLYSMYVYTYTHTHTHTHTQTDILSGHRIQTLLTLLPARTQNIFHPHITALEEYYDIIYDQVMEVLTLRRRIKTSITWSHTRNRMQTPKIIYDVLRAALQKHVRIRNKITFVGLWWWYFNVTITILDIIHRPVYYLKRNSTLYVCPHVTGKTLSLRYESNRFMLYIGLWRWHINITITILNTINYPILYLKTQLKDRAMDNVQNCDSYIRNQLLHPKCMTSLSYAPWSLS
jgi:hypothetical protein